MAAKQWNSSLKGNDDEAEALMAPGSDDRYGLPHRRSSRRSRSKYIMTALALAIALIISLHVLGFLQLEPDITSQSPEPQRHKPPPPKKKPAFAQRPKRPVWQKPKPKPKPPPAKPKPPAAAQPNKQVPAPLPVDPPAATSTTTEAIAAAVGAAVASTSSSTSTTVLSTTTTTSVAVSDGVANANAAQTPGDHHYPQPTGYAASHRLADSLFPQELEDPEETGHPLQIHTVPSLPTDLANVAQDASNAAATSPPDFLEELQPPPDALGSSDVVQPPPPLDGSNSVVGEKLAPGGIDVTSEPPKAKRKALVISSYRNQHVEWMEGISKDWEVYRYLMDDKTAEYKVPSQNGREAMTYTTFIINHYANLPDYVVFIHGHRRSWHAPEPTDLKIEALNFTALDNDKFINLRCQHNPTCHPKNPINLAAVQNDPRPYVKVIPRLWKHLNMTEGDDVPAGLSSPCCAQFAVTKDAILSRSLDWWYTFRKPLFGKLKQFRLDSFDWGMTYEKIWHVAFGMNPVHCPPIEYCFNIQWSMGVLCSGYPAIPLDGHWGDCLRVGKIQCFKNDNNTKEWTYNKWTTNNITRKGKKPPRDLSNFVDFSDEYDYNDWD